MHKKYVKSLFLFLTLLMIIITITTVSATDINETSTISHDTNTQSVVLSEKTSNDYNPEKNNEQMYTNDNSLNTKTNDNLNDTTSVETKSLKKYNKTENKEYTYKTSSTLTVGSTKTVYVGDKVSIYGRLSSYSSRIPYSKVEIEINNKYYYATTNAYGDYKLNVTGSNQGTNYIYARYYGSDKYYSSSTSTTFTVNKKTSNLTVGSTKTTYVGDKLSIYGKLSARGIGLAYKNVEIDVDGKLYTVTTSKYGNYNLKVTALDEGYNYITATYYGSDVYTYDTASTSFTANNKNVLTLGSTKSVYVGDKVSVYGKLTSKGKNVANAKITVTLDYTTYTTYTSQYGNYNLKVTPSTSGTKTITAKYTDNNYNSVYNTTTFQANKKITNLTVGSTKSVYVGDKVSVYGKLSARGIGLAYKEVEIDVEGNKYYVTTSKYGNYNLKVTADKEGYNDITATYAGTNIYASDSAYTYVYASKKITSITVGSTKSTYVGDTISVYGKLSARGIGLAYKNVEIDVEGIKYYATTSKYGNYNIKVTADYLGSNDITATYYGSNIYTKDSAKTTFNALSKNSKPKTIELTTYSMSYAFSNPRYVGSDQFISFYTTVNGQWYRGVYATIQPYDINIAPDNKILKATFYFKNSKGNIITRTGTIDSDIIASTDLISGYTPYKAVVTYRRMTEQEKYNLWYGY